MYLVLSQQKFSPNCVSGQNTTCNNWGPHKEYNQNLFYGLPLYLSLDMTHFIYDNVKYIIKLKNIEQIMAKHHTNAESGIKNIIDAHFKRFIYDINNISDERYFVVTQINDNNIYLHDKYEFNHVSFNDMRFELIR